MSKSTRRLRSLSIYILSLLISSACSTQSEIVGTWDAIEKDGMQFPIILEGETAQDELGDPNLQRSVQEMQISIESSGQGILISNFEMTNLDGSEYDFSFPMPMTIDFNVQPYVLVATDEEIGEEITMLCTLTQAGLLSCSYTINEPNSPEGTLTFREHSVES